MSIPQKDDIHYLCVIQAAPEILICHVYLLLYMLHDICTSFISYVGL